MLQKKDNGCVLPLYTANLQDEVIGTLIALAQQVDGLPDKALRKLVLGGKERGDQAFILSFLR